MVTTRERKTQTDSGFTGLFMLSSAVRRPDYTSIEAYLGNESAVSAIQDARRSVQDEADAQTSVSPARPSSASNPQEETSGPTEASLSHDFSGARGDLSAAREGRVIVWGDSIARGLAGHLSAQGGVVNIGRDGAGLLASTHTRSFSEVPDGGLHRGDTVVISIGTNDIDAIKNGGERALARFEAALTERIDEIRAAGATPVLLDVRNTTGGYTGGSDIWQSNDYVMGWNRTADRLNRFFTAYSSENGIAYVQTNHTTEISRDNLHPSGHGFDQMARALTLS